MTSYKVFDAAYPPAAAPPGMAGVLGYIGGNATHVWTPGEWQRFAHLRQFPCYVAELSKSPQAAAHDALELAQARGWAAHEADTRVIVFDLETQVDKAWYQAVAAAVGAAGFLAVCYGSMSTVFGNGAEFVWAASWDTPPIIPAHVDLHGVQYDANVSYGGTQVDYSVVDAWLIDRGGVGPRHG